MPRPIKTRLDYFPMDPAFLLNQRICSLIITHGAYGPMVYITVICEVYNSYGYYTYLNDSLYISTAYKLRLEVDTVKEIVDTCIKIELFDTRMAKEKQVLTSTTIQKYYSFARKRGNLHIDPEYALLKDVNIFPDEKGVFASFTGVNVTETPVNVTIPPQNVQ